MSQKAYKKAIAERNRIKRFIASKNKEISPKSKLPIESKNAIMEEIKLLREQLQYIETDIAQMEKANVEQMPVEETTVDQAPMEQTTVEETTIDQAPMEQMPVEETIIDQAPMEQMPVEETTIGDAPLQDVVGIFSDDIFQVAPRIIENNNTEIVEEKTDVEFFRTKAEQEFVDAVLASEEKEKEKEISSKFPTATTEKVADEKVKVKMPDGWTAKKIIDTFDKIQSVAFPFLYDFSLLTSEERELIRLTSKKEPTLELIEDGKKRLIIDYTNEELNAIKKAEKIETYKDAIPLTSEEKEDIKIPLEEYLKDKGVELSPGWALVIVVCTIMLSRSMPILMEKGTEFLDKLIVKNEVAA